MVIVSVGKEIISPVCANNEPSIKGVQKMELNSTPRTKTYAEVVKTHVNNEQVTCKRKKQIEYNQR